MPASPFQASGETSPGKNDDLPRTIAGSTPLPLGRRSFAVSGPLAPVRSASYPVPVRRLTGSFHASFSVRLTTNALRFPSVPATRFREDFHLQVIAHAGPTTTNTAATGAPAITGTAQVGQTLTAVTTGITDADGLTSPTYTYQWIRVDGTEADIAGENSSTYTLVDADLGKTIKVKVSFTDDASHTETLTSAATVTVTAAAAPGSPKNLSATVGVGQVVLVWESPDTGERVSHYEYRSSAGAMISPGAMWQQVLSSAGTLNQAYYQVVKGLTSGTTHTFQVRAVNPQGGSAPATVTATPISQPSCTIDELGGRRLLWQGQLVAGVQSVSTDGSVSVGNAGGVDPGTLTPDAVTFRSTTYSVTTSTSDDYLNVVLRDEDTVWYPPEEVVDALRLHVCNTPYDFSSATVPDLFAQFSGYRWNGGFNWPPGIERTLRLSLPPNHVATGDPVISGTAQAGQELTADASPIMDADGLPSSFTYQWVRVDADGLSNPADITDATAGTYTLTAADAGKTIKVQVSFTDELSGEEMRTSAAYPSSGTVTAASTTAPALTSVTVTSTPHKTTDTYGAREHIEFSMTFDAPVTVTGDPTFAFDLGGASTATYYAGSGTVTLRFSHAVSGGSSGDEDTNGISWAENAIALNGGTIAGTDNAVAAVLTHVAQSNLAGHKVDGRTTAVTPATVTVAVTSTPTSLADTYGFGETIVITVTASEAVEVVGDPEFEFSLTDMGGSANDVPATYDRHAQQRDDDRIHLHGAGGRPGQQRHLDRRPQPNLHAGRERPHPHGLAADRHRPQPSREGHARRPQGGRIPGGADRTAGSHGADPGVGHRHDAHHRVDAPG